MSISLPNVSIITPTFSRRNFFPLALHNFKSFDYPADKLEWIILDDGTDSISDLIPKNDPRIKYFYYDKDTIDKLYQNFIDNYREKKKNYKHLSKKLKKGKKYKLQTFHKNHFKNFRIPIGMKRNICIQYASNNYIIHMDDDDIYPPDSIKIRIEALMKNETENKVECVGCPSVACFHINKLISVVYNPNIKLSPANKIACSTLAYTKKFWNQQKFENQDIANELYSFLKGRDCCELPWENIIVALFHSNNDRNINIFSSGEPNGWHYHKVSDKFFEFIVNLDPNGDNQDK